MPGDLSANDPKTVWLNQPTERPTMILKLIEQKSRDLRAKTRKKLLGTLAGPLAAGLFYLFGTKEFPSLQPLLQPLFALALVWSLAGLYFLNRGMWPAAVPGDAGLSTGLQSCRREIERQRALVRRVLLWSLGPALLSIATLIAALAMAGTRERGILPNGLPFLLLVVAWIVGYFMIRLKEQRTLQREIEELKDLEKENRPQLSNF